MTHDRGLFKSKAIVIHNELKEQFPTVLANLIHSYISPQDYIESIMSTEHSLGECADELAHYLKTILEKNKQLDIASLFNGASIKPFFDIIKTLWRNSEFIEGRLVYVHCLRSKHKSPYENNDKEKEYIHELIEKNDHIILEILLAQNPDLLEGEMKRHFIYRALDGISKITNIDLAITLNSVESLQVLLKHEKSVFWLSGFGKGNITSTLDLAISQGGKRTLEVCQLLICAYLKKLLLNIQDLKLTGFNTAKDYANHMEHIIIKCFSHAKELAASSGNKELIILIDKANKLLDLSINALEIEIHNFEKEKMNSSTVEAAEQKKSEEHDKHKCLMM